MHDSGLDFLEFIILLGVVLAITFNTVIPIMKESNDLYYSETYDKTASKLNGLSAEDAYDGAMTVEEVTLAVIGQNYFMPNPGKLNICGLDIEVSNNIAFSPNSLDLGNKTRVSIQNWYNKFKTNGYSIDFEDVPMDIGSARFMIMFDMNSGDTNSDDTYSLYIKLTPRGEKYSKIYKCDTNGKLRDEGGNIR